MKPEVSRLFAAMLDTISRQEVKKLVTSAVRNQYGKDTEWDISNWWQVAVPLPRYEARGLPSLIVETRAYSVASVEVTRGWGRRSWHIALVEPLGKPRMTLLPLCFLQALLDGNEDRYRIVGKDGRWTLREVAGLKQPLRLHDDFVNQLHHVFRLEPVADWLDDFGSRGHSLVPLVVGSLLGLMHRGEAVAEYGSQLEAREVLRKQNEALRVEEEKRQENLAELRTECQRDQEVLSQLRTDLAEQERLRRFWQRFKGTSQILEYLARWDQVIPMRCNWFFCGARFLVDQGPSSFRTKLTCPCCGLGLVYYDDEAFTTLGLSYRTPIKIELGE